MINLKELFPLFNNELLAEIEKYGEIKEVKANDVLMRQ